VRENTLSEVGQSAAVRIYLLIENRLLREALDRLFKKRPDLNVVGRGGQSEITPEQLQELNCDVVAFDFFDARWFAAGSGADCAVGAKPLLIGMGGDSREFLSAVQAGVRGYLLKDASTTEVLAAVRATFRGEAVCPAKLCLTLFEHVAKMSKKEKPRGASERPDLTLRQQQLMVLVAKGMTNKEIASRLNLSEFTIRNHIHRILKQVDAESRSEAVEVVMGHGYPVNS
jgi:DNA-binding NarL/FixJ family response regulator